MDAYRFSKDLDYRLINRDEITALIKTHGSCNDFLKNKGYDPGNTHSWMTSTILFASQLDTKKFPHKKHRDKYSYTQKISSVDLSINERRGHAVSSIEDVVFKFNPNWINKIGVAQWGEYELQEDGCQQRIVIHNPELHNYTHKKRPNNTSDQHSIYFDNLLFLDLFKQSHLHVGSALFGHTDSINQKIGLYAGGALLVKNL